MALGEDEQKVALGKLSPQAKQDLFLGIKAYQSFQPPKERPQQEDKGWLSGLAGRAVDTLKGLKHLAAPMGDVEEQERLGIGKGIVETYKQGAKQTAEQVKSGVQTFPKDPTIGSLKVAQGVTTGASMLDPFATGSVVDVNRMEAEGRYREAIGAGAFDVLTLWAGSRTLKGPFGAKPLTTEARVNKLAAASGEHVSNLERAFPDLEAASQRVGQPKTVGEFQNMARDAMTSAEATFQGDFALFKNMRVTPHTITQNIDEYIRKNPNLAQTPEGRLQLRALNRYKTIYDKPWTLEEMNIERSRLRKDLRSYYDAKPSTAIAKTKLDADLAAKKIVADTMADTVNSYVGHFTGKGKGFYDALRLRQEALVDLMDTLDKKVDKLRDQQALHQARGPLGRTKPHAYASAGGPRVHVPFGEVFSAGPEKEASGFVRDAYPSTTRKAVKQGTRATVLSLPVSHLLTAGEEERKSRGGLTPPPAP
jgi:hypothetical protein